MVFLTHVFFLPKYVYPFYLFLSKTKNEYIILFLASFTCYKKRFLKFFPFFVRWKWIVFHIKQCDVVLIVRKRMIVSVLWHGNHQVWPLIHFQQKRREMRRKHHINSKQIQATDNSGSLKTIGRISTKKTFRASSDLVLNKNLSTISDVTLEFFDQKSYIPTFWRCLDKGM